MIYWYARPSEHVPTLEIRVCDVNADLDVVLLLTAVVRGLATALLLDIGVGRPRPTCPPGACMPYTGSPPGTGWRAKASTPREASPYRP
ncbi:MULTISPECIES: hypothetical protein [unclassified Streptomyces]|uniref:hypothetical protein n=1 Tax=unclassified Streptomyces TaxID=2593676 RepID=UPI0035DFAA5A